MGRKKTRQNTTNITLNINNDVLDALESYCANAGTNRSAFINFLVQEKVQNKIEFYRSYAQYHYREFSKYNTLKEQEISIKIDNKNIKEDKKDYNDISGLSIPF